MLINHAIDREGLGGGEGLGGECVAHVPSIGAVS
jgi:hypothetical protein